MRSSSFFTLTATLVLLLQRASALAVPDGLYTRFTAPAWKFDGTGHYNLTLPNNRWALVHTHPSFDNSKAHPLVLAFHGASANAQNMEAISNLTNDTLTINGTDIVMVYGQGTLGANNGNDWQGAPYSSAADDIAYTQAILTAVQANLNIDATRVYTVGFSNGAGLVNLLACTPSMAPQFAAFATSSPALYNATLAFGGCDSGGHAVALIDFHGLNDGVVPYAGRTDRSGDTRYALPNIDSWRQQWAQRAGCAAPTDGSRMAPTTVTTNYMGQNATAYEWDCPQATIIGFTVQTMAHFWLTKSQGYWDVTPINIMTFFNTRTL